MPATGIDQPCNVADGTPAINASSNASASVPRIPPYVGVCNAEPYRRVRDWSFQGAQILELTVSMISENAAVCWLYPSLSKVQNSSVKRPSPRGSCYGILRVRRFEFNRAAKRAFDLLTANRNAIEAGFEEPLRKGVAA